MRVTIQKWGNSLALRIPKAYGEELGMKESSAVNLRIEKSALVVKPEKKRKKLALRELIAGINQKNRHTAIETGSAVGEEIW